MTGTSFGFDVNPVVDRVRVVSDSRENFRLHPSDGGVVSPDGTLTYAVGDPNEGQTPLLSGCAYTNNVTPTPLVTSLFAIDTQQNTLVLVNPPNAGIVNTIGALGVDPTNVSGFDIYGGAAADGGFPAFDKPMTAYAALVITNPQPELYTINLQTGAATKVGNILHNAVLIGIAVEP
jgi:hypothetical protein